MKPSSDRNPGGGDMGDGILATILQYCAIGLLVLGVAGFGIAELVEANRQARNPEKKEGRYTIAPKQERVFEKLSPLFGRTADFTNGGLYDVRTVNGDTVMFNGRPLESDTAFMKKTDSLLNKYK